MAAPFCAIVWTSPAKRLPRGLGASLPERLRPPREAAFSFRPARAGARNKRDDARPSRAVRRRAAGAALHKKA